MSISRCCWVVLCVMVGWTAPSFADEEADHQALRDLKGVYEKAIADNNLDLLAPHLHEDFSGVMVTGEVVKGLDDLRQYWSKIQEMMGEGGVYTCTLKPDRSILMGDAAISKGLTEDKVVTGAGKTYEFSTAWTAVLHRVNGEWKILRIQGAMDPITNEFVGAAVQGATTMAGGVGAVVGILLGFGLRSFMGRKRPTAN